MVFLVRQYCVINTNSTLQQKVPISNEKLIIGHIISANPKHKHDYVYVLMKQSQQEHVFQYKFVIVTVKNIPFSNEGKYDGHVRRLPHFICCSVFPRCALKGRK